MAQRVAACWRPAGAVQKVSMRYVVRRPEQVQWKEPETAQPV